MRVMFDDYIQLVHIRLWTFPLLFGISKAKIDARPNILNIILGSILSFVVTSFKKKKVEIRSIL